LIIDVKSCNGYWESFLFCYSTLASKLGSSASQSSCICTVLIWNSFAIWGTLEVVSFDLLRGNTSLYSKEMNCLYRWLHGASSSEGSFTCLFVSALPSPLLFVVSDVQYLLVSCSPYDLCGCGQNPKSERREISTQKDSFEWLTSNPALLIKLCLFWLGILMWVRKLG